jgi:zinc protease
MKDDLSAARQFSYALMTKAAAERLRAQERGAIEQEVDQDYSSPEFIFYTRLLAAMFKGTPYEESPLGSVSSFDKTTGEMLKKFYQTWYAPNNAVLVVVGDVIPEKALAGIKRHFDHISPKRIPPRPGFSLEPVKLGTVSCSHRASRSGSH